MQGFDADGNQICADEEANVPDGHTAFIGFRDDAGRIVSVALTYLSTQAESVDDLYFSATSPTAEIFVFPVQVAPGGQPARQRLRLPIHCRPVAGALLPW